jgi:hypothetical protein
MGDFLIAFALVVFGLGFLWSRLRSLHYVQLPEGVRLLELITYACKYFSVPGTAPIYIETETGLKRAKAVYTAKFEGQSVLIISKRELHDQE